MKKVLLILTIFFCAAGNAQITYINKSRVDSVSNDSSCSNPSKFNLVTSWMLKHYTDKLISSSSTISLIWDSIKNKPTATALQSGLLSSADWNGFNGKQNALNSTVALAFVKANGTTIIYDTSHYATTTQLATKVNISDTANMLTKYLRKIDTANMLTPYLRSNTAASTYATTVALNGKLDTSGAYINNVVVNSDVLYSNPATSRTNHVLYVTQNLATQTAYRVFAIGSSNGTPVFLVIDSNYFNNQFSAQVNAAAKDASSSVRGFVNTSSQTFGGTKTFADIVATSSATIPNIYGNTSGTGQLNLNSTSASSPSVKSILLDGVSVFDGINKRLGVNNTTPSYSIHTIGKNTYDNGIVAAQGNNGVWGGFYAIKTSGGVTNDAVGVFDIINNGTARAGMRGYQKDGTNDNSNLEFSTCATGGSMTKRMEITTSGEVQVVNNLNLSTAGSKMKITTGTNASAGTATLSSGTVTVNTTAVTASSIIILTVQETGTNNGRVKVSARVANTSFTISSSDSGDNCVVAYQIIN